MEVGGDVNAAMDLLLSQEFQCEIAASQRAARHAAAFTETSLAEQTATLVSLGFSAAAARAALERTRDLNAAMDLLTSQEQAPPQNVDTQTQCGIA